MLSKIIITMIFRAIPEGFIHIYAMYAMACVKIDKKKYLLSSMLLAGIMILVSNLPISYGINSILIVMAMISLAVMMNGLRTSYCISIAIMNMIIQFLAEGINIIFIQKVLQMDMTKIMSDPISKVLYGVPSLVFFGGTIFIVAKMNKKRQRNKDV